MLVPPPSWLTLTGGLSKDALVPKAAVLPAPPDFVPADRAFLASSPSVQKVLPELKPGAEDRIELKVGDTLETTFSMRLLIPEEELGAPIDDYGRPPDDVFKPRDFDEWIRSRLTAAALERQLNADLAKEHGTTRVAVELCEVLSTRPVASEVPELRGKGLGIQRAEVRVRIRVTHNALLLVGILIGVAIASFAALAVVVYANRPTVDELHETAGRKIGRFVGDVTGGAVESLFPLALLAALAWVALR